MIAVMTNMKVLLQLDRVNHRTAIRALDPKAFRHVFAAVFSAQAGFVENAHGVEKFLSLKRRVDRIATATLNTTRHPDNTDFTSTP
jgi:hypothetical protein